MRIATIGLCDPGYSVPLATAHHARAVEALRRAVPDLVDAGLQPEEAASGPALRQLRQAHAECSFDALVLVQAAWSRPDVLLQVIRAFPTLPMVLYAPGSALEDGVIRSSAPTAGVGSSLPILRLHRIPHVLAYSFPGEPIDEADFLPFLRACAARTRLRGMKLGMVGFGDMRLLTTGFDVQELHAAFGVEVESIDMLQVQQGMAALDPADIDRQVRALAGDWQAVGTPPSPETLRATIAAFLVLDRLATEREWAGVSIKCPTGMAEVMGFTPCMIGTLLARRCHYVCENDIPGLLGQVILGLLSDRMSAYWEYYEVLREGILFGCCGFCPESFQAGPVRVHTVAGFMEGICCCGAIAPGDYTVARLGRQDGRYLFHAAEGAATAPPAWYEDSCGTTQHPSVCFRPDVPVSEFLRGVLAQHVAVAPGRWGRELAEFARLAL